MNLHLMRPEWLLAILPALLLAAGLWRQRQRGGGWREVIAPDLLPHLLADDGGTQRRNLIPWLLLAWIIAALAASGPSWKQVPQPVHQKQDALVLVLDLSYSMVAGDLAPSRIDRARQKLLDLLERRREGQTGLIAYAGDAHIVTPLTDDTPTIANLLPALQPDIMPVPGSNPAAAVSQAVELLRSAGVRDGRVLLVTDGISRADREALRTVLEGSAVDLAIMGVGTPTGAPLPLPRGGFLKDERGNIVMPGLEESVLRSVAADHGGRYRRLQVDDSDLDALLAEDPLTGKRDTLATDRTADAWEDQGHWLALALLLPVLALFRRGWVVCLAPLLLAVPSAPTQAGIWDDLWLTPDQQGQRALQAGDPARAAELFGNGRWAGTAAYQAGDFETAAERFASGDSADDWYNRGNALARAGQLDAAIDAYREALARQPDAVDARDNLALLEQLRDQQQQRADQEGEGQNQQDGQPSDSAADDRQGEGAPSQDGAGQPPSQAQESAAQESGDSDRQQDSPGDPGTPQPGQDSSDEGGDARQQAPQEDGPDQPGASAPGEADESPRPGDELMDMARSAASSTDPEKRQAMEQWLRRVPDDPSGLLREKFRYESRKRQQQGEVKDDDTYW